MILVTTVVKIVKLLKIQTHYLPMFVRKFWSAAAAPAVEV